MEPFWQDLQYSVRALLKRPASLSRSGTLALGISANATIFTWIKAVLLARLPDMEHLPRKQGVVDGDDH